jgi:D-threonate/D-erythronate kinase
MKLLIVADDVSGAADCAAGCVQSGLRSVVLLDGEADASGYDVVAVDADSRHLPPERAAAAQLSLLQRLSKARPALFYKKIDSTLRGQFVAELKATWSISGTPILAPAFPGMGRTMVDGQVLIEGVPLADTEVWRNEGRTGPSTLPAMLQQGGFDPVVIPLEQIRGDLDLLRAAFAARVTEPQRAIVCDAETEDDLARIALGSAGLAGRCHWVGSGGLVRHLPAAHGLAGDAAATPRGQVAASRGPVLTVVGSVSTASRRQCECLAAACRMPQRAIDPELLRQGSDHPQWTAAQQSLFDLLLNREGLVVTIGGDTRDLREGRMLVASLAHLLAPAWKQVGGLILTGGETARAVFSGWGVHALELVGELEAGIPLSNTVGSRRVPVITKAGAFGSVDCLARGWRLLQSAS